MALEISGNNTSVGKNMSTASILIVLSVIAFLSGSLMSALDDDVSFLSALLMLGGLVFGSLAFFRPITEAMNVASKIDIINEYNGSELISEKKRHISKFIRGKKIKKLIDAELFILRQLRNQIFYGKFT